MHAASSSVMTDSGSADSRRQACLHRNHASLTDRVTRKGGRKEERKEGRGKGGRVEGVKEGRKEVRK